MTNSLEARLAREVDSSRRIEIIEEERLVENARLVGEHLLRGLIGLQDELGGLLTNARGRGLLIGFDLGDAETRNRAQEKIIEAGLLVLTCGVRSIRFRPSLNLTTAEADIALDLVRRGLKQL